MDYSLFYLPTYREGFSPSLADYYEEIIDEVKLADRLGWNRVMTTEHHFHYYGGAVTNPAIMLTAWARETKNIRLAAGVSLVPLRHPLQVAEDYAMVDQLSGGRFDMGVSRGFVPHEFAAFGVGMEETADRVSEGLDVIEKFWEGKPFSWKGKFYEFDKIQPWPETIQKEIPIWVAASNAQESFERAGARGANLMMNQYPMSYESLVQKHTWFCDAHAKAGHDPKKRRSMVAFMTHLADTEEQAIAEAKLALQEHVNAFQHVLKHDEWNRDYLGDESILQAVNDSDDILDVFRKRTLICTPEQAAERMAKYVDLGFTEMCFVLRYGSMTHTQVCETLERLAKEVRPMLGLSKAAA